MYAVAPHTGVIEVSANTLEYFSIHPTRPRQKHLFLFLESMKTLMELWYIHEIHGVWKTASYIFNFYYSTEAACKYMLQLLIKLNFPFPRLILMKGQWNTF